MKTFYCLIIFFISLQIYGQQNALQSEPIWKLDVLHVNGVNYTPPIASNNTYTLKFFDTNLMASGECNVGHGNYTINQNESTFLTTEYSFTLMYCTEMDAKYITFFEPTLDTSFTYEVVTLLSGGEVILDIYKSTGDFARFEGKETMSIKNNTLKNLSIYPSLVKDKLFITSSNNLTDVTINIFNISGSNIEIIKGSKLKDHTSINLEHLNAGIYIISIEDQFGNSTVKKFIKK